MEIVDLFCGGGGSSTGFHQAGFTTTYAVDTEWHCVNTFNSNHGNVSRQQDIAKLRSEDILNSIDDKPTIVTASPPCEPFTVANRKRIKDPYTRLYDDPIGRLTIDALRLIADLDPEFYFIENVKGIIDGENQQLLKEEIEDLGLGRPQFNWINAPDWGIPSHRVRVVISNLRLENPHLPHRTVRDVIGDLPDPRYPHHFEFHSVYYHAEKYTYEYPTLAPGQGLVHFYGSNKDYLNYIRLYYDRPAPVVMGKSKLVHPTDDRLLTLFEHARLMTFPDDYNYMGSISQMYDIIGEAVPPKIAEEIGKQVKMKL